MLIDSGVGFEKIRDMVCGLTDLPIVVANTHAHLDHIGGNYLFGDAWIHEDDKDVYALHTDPAYTNNLIHEVLPWPLRIVLGRTVRAHIGGRYLRGVPLLPGRPCISPR